jgi:hypothetical protein
MIKIYYNTATGEIEQIQIESNPHNLFPDTRPHISVDNLNDIGTSRVDLQTLTLVPK